MGTTNVIFSHDDETKKWSVYVEGEKEELQARLSFAAVILSCGRLNPVLQALAGVTRLEDGRLEITPAMTANQPSAQEAVKSRLVEELGKLMREACDSNSANPQQQSTS